MPCEHRAARYTQEPRARRERITQARRRPLPSPPARPKAIGEPAPGSAGPRLQPLPCLATGESHMSSPLAPPARASWRWPGPGSRGLRHPGSLGTGSGCGDCSIYCFLNTWLYLFPFFLLFFL